MSTGTDRRESKSTPLSRAESTAEIAVVPSALYTLRAIVLGVAAVVGTIGMLAFVEVPDAAPRPAAAGFTSNEIVSRPDCEAPCLGRAVAVQELDMLPVGLDARALAVIARAESEPPMAATPPPRTEHQPSAGPDRDDGESDNKSEKKKKGRHGAGTADESPSDGHDKDRDNDDEDD